MTRRLLGIVLAVAALGVLPAGAAAHSVMSIDNGTITYSATDDVSLNQLDITIVDDRIRFYDPGADGGIAPPSACEPGEVDPKTGYIREVRCPRSGIERLRVDVGEAQDRVRAATPLPALIAGGNGADDLAGGSGADTINADLGNDRIDGAGGDDTLLAGPGDDTVTGGAGNDVVQAAGGADLVDGGDGNDDLRIRDGAADRALCGGGADVVQADAFDDVDAACETVDRGTATADSTADPGSSADGPAAGGDGDGSGGGGSAGGTSPSTWAGAGTTRSDTTPPRVRAGGSTLQRLRGGRTLVVLATSSEVAELVAAGYVVAGERRLVLTPTRRRVTVGGGGAELRLRLDPRAARAVRRALRRRQRVRAIVSVVATDRAGNSSATRLPAIALRR